MHAYPSAPRPVPVRYAYRPYYTRWYVHPYYRYTYATTVVVGFGFPCYPWSVGWMPPVRAGWMWMDGYWAGTYWMPGYWSPMAVAPVGYVYVPGWWQGTVYIDGYYRPQVRHDGDWRWQDGYYLDDGTYVRGHWEPTRQGPSGYTWEAGFWDGQTWVEGFWRPDFRAGFTWVSAYYDEDGVMHAGYWAPLDQRPGSVWIPGWFDGNQWIEGYWVAETQYESEDVQGWQPEAGWDDGHDDRREAAPQSYADDEQPLGIPVE